MKIINAKIYTLNIPFNFSFGHYLKERSYSDSIVVELISDTGISGFGEGIARPYVTGETVEKSVKYIKKVLLPGIVNKNLVIDFKKKTIDILTDIDKYFSNKKKSGIIAWNAAKSAVELALIDVLLNISQKSINNILPSKKEIITYTGVISSGDIKKTVQYSNLLKKNKFKYIKIKVGANNDIERIKTVRDIMGSSVSIRLDANGAFDVGQALKFIESVRKFNIDSIEQPIKRGKVKDFVKVKSDSSIPIMADESIITFEDAENLIANNACDYFNLRIAKCGGIYNTLKIAELAIKENIKIQLGCLVGETAILSAAGRSVAAYLPDINFVEGSYSALLLSEDIAEENIVFGKRGEAAILTGTGLGVNINKKVLNKYTEKIETLQL